MTPEFRRALFKFKYNEEKDGAAEHCIPLQLQKLFGFLLLSKVKAVDTIALTKSFGWEGSEVFQQQDVQELTRVSSAPDTSNKNACHFAEVFVHFDHSLTSVFFLIYRI
jgi:hypothetical protein